MQNTDAHLATANTKIDSTLQALCRLLIEWSERRPEEIENFFYGTLLKAALQNEALSADDMLENLPAGHKLSSKRSFFERYGLLSDVSSFIDDDKLERIPLFLVSYAYCGKALKSLRDCEIINAWDAIIEANLWLGVVATTSWGSDKRGPSLVWLAKRGAAAKLANDPKQHAKEDVYLQWQGWSTGSVKYGSRNSQADFARAMLKKWDGTLVSQPAIEEWCRQWRRNESMPLTEPAQ